MYVIPASGRLTGSDDQPPPMRQDRAQAGIVGALLGCALDANHQASSEPRGCEPGAAEKRPYGMRWGERRAAPGTEPDAALLGSGRCYDAGAGHPSPAQAMRPWMAGSMVPAAWIALPTTWSISSRVVARAEMSG